MASHLYGWNFRQKPLLTGGSGRIMPHVGQSSKRVEAESIKIKGFWVVRPDAHPMKVGIQEKASREKHCLAVRAFFRCP